MWATGPFLAACALLAWSGAVKIARPDSARAILRALRWPSSRGAVRALGVVEIAVAAAGATFGGLGALVVAGLFVALAIVAQRLRTRAPDAPCGCLGSNATTTRAHVAVNLVAAFVAVTAAFSGSPVARIAYQPLAGAPFVVLVACAAWLTALVMEAQPAFSQPSSEGARR